MTRPSTRARRAVAAVKRYGPGSSPEERDELLIDDMNDALCWLLHRGDEVGDHSPEAHVKLFHRRVAADQKKAAARKPARVAKREVGET